METLKLIGLIILGLLVVIGIIRSLFSSSRGIFNFIIELLWLDFLFDIFGWILETITDIFD